MPVKTLADRFRECRDSGLAGIPRMELLYYLVEIADELDELRREHGLQHLDVKPENLFLDRATAYLLDPNAGTGLPFGITATGQVAPVFATQRGVTPVYAAPETFEGRISDTTDQYSLAIVFAEMLTGCRPFNGKSMQELLMQHLWNEPDLLALSKRDRAVVERALSKKPEERYPSCREFIAALVR